MSRRPWVLKRIGECVGGMVLEAKPLYALRDWLLAVEDQVDYQRLGGVCAKHPYSCYFCNVLRVLRGRYGLGNAIVDVTYGFGSFYVACRSAYRIVGIDVVRREWLVEPDEFRQCDSTVCYRELPRQSFDIMVVDPPFATRPSPRIRGDSVRSQLYEGREAYERIMRAVPRMARHLVKPGGVVLIKGMDVKEHGVIEYRHMPYYWMAVYAGAGLEPVDLLYYRFRAQRITTRDWITVKNYTWLLVLRVK